MKRNQIAVLLASTAVALFSTASAERADAAPASSHAAMVERGSAEVMPFDMNRTMHMFDPLPDGGVQTVIVHDGDPRQIVLVRSHLRKEAHAFARGDFADPATIHGTDMPGLAQLHAGASRLDITYLSAENGASIRFKTSDPKLVEAIHAWFAAQVKDHGAHAMMMEH